jgi:L-rhamnose isomerase / sugar isomerase
VRKPPWSIMKSSGNIRRENEQVDAEECVRDAFSTDVRPAVAEWRTRRGLPADALRAFRESGYEARVGKGRKARRAELGLSVASSYA